MHTSDQTIPHQTIPAQEISDMMASARKASRSLLQLTPEQTAGILLRTADTLVDATDLILAANRLDLGRMDPANPKYDRLMLTADRIAAIAADMRNVAALPSPQREIDRRVRPNGLEITRVAVPFGVIGIIYEARPNVTADVFSLCLRSGNACVLKGGHDAADTNRAIVDVIHGVLREVGVDTGAAVLLPPTREATDLLLEARGVVDLIIPRGSSSLIQSVREKSKVPVIETGAGVCHCYIDSQADTAMAAAIVHNAKTRRVSVCNALDCVLVHRDRLGDLAGICQPLAAQEVVVHADEQAYARLQGSYPANLLKRAEPKDYGTEYLAYEMAVRTVDSLEQALEHIARYGSGHSESIVTASDEAARVFCRDVDAACVYVNAPTSFTDGAQFGLGAEIGISTQKLHARGPMALDELMTYKWLIHGNGQTRK